MLADADGNIVAQQKVGATSAIVITGSNTTDDTLVLGLEASRLTVPVTFDGLGGRDTLNGPADDTTWNITGPDSGSVAGVQFVHGEHLLGAVDNEDTFVLASGGSVTSGIDRGAGGFDSLVLDGGTLATIK